MNISIPYLEEYNNRLFYWDRESLKSLFKKFQRDPSTYFVVVEDESEKVVGWFAGAPGHYSHHSPVKAMSQLYYHCNLQGLSGLRALRLVHEGFFTFAEKREFEMVISSSVLPNSYNFIRCLQSIGWTEVGPGVAARITSFYLGQQGDATGTPVGQTHPRLQAAQRLA